jgi:hypothetical protein
VDRSEAINFAFGFKVITVVCSCLIVLLARYAPTVVFFLHPHGHYAQGYDHTRALATWWFFHPALVARFATDKDTEGTYKRLKGIMKSRQRITSSEEAFLVQCLEDDSVKGMVMRIEQYHGEGVHVPPGWAHMVWNVQPCVKYAWDLYVPQHIPAYVKAWDVASALYLAEDEHERDRAPDYMRVPLVILQYLVEHADCVCDMIREKALGT